MKTLQVVNQTRECELGEQVWLADSWWPRLRGLIGRRLEAGQGLVLAPCKAVHMHGMKQALDVAFVDGSGAVVAVYPDLAPGRRTRFHKPARKAIELPPGTLAQTGTQVGDVLSCRPSEEER
ncbi:MAG: DUF192 domain-containing protein [Gemmatimonadota bacterium]